MEIGQKIERKWKAHFVDAALPKATEPIWERLGKDLEELNVSMNAQVDKKKNILGESSINISSYEPQADVAPYYAVKGTALFDRLQQIYDERLVLDDLKTSTLDVNMWTADDENATEFEAYREEAFFELTSAGGDTTGYQLPFNLHYTGIRTKGKYDASTGKFTPASGAAAPAAAPFASPAKAPTTKD